jgi:hypothetical protein
MLDTFDCAHAADTPRRTLSANRCLESELLITVDNLPKPKHTQKCMFPFFRVAPCCCLLLHFHVCVAVFCYVEVFYYDALMNCLILSTTCLSAGLL